MVMYRDPIAQLEECSTRAQALLAQGEFGAALEALDEIPKRYQASTALLAFRCQVYLAAGNWEIAAGLAARLAECEPEQPGHWIQWAYAVRRLRSIDDAEKILTTARQLHPKCATIHFNLACYASQTGRMVAALALLRTAVSLDPDTRTLAASDPDLQPLLSTLPPDDPLRPPV